VLYPSYFDKSENTMGFALFDGSPTVWLGLFALAEFTDFLRQDNHWWGQAIRNTGLKLDGVCRWSAQIAVSFRKGTCRPMGRETRRA
jgi:hypothetical protein